MENSVKILWADDEIDLLKPHVLFLEQKGYQVDTINNGLDALDMIQETNYDIIFLDENMPGLSGLESLQKIKEKNPSLPVVMITKSEEESIMESAIGRNISDYLIKPVNPNQIILSLKKNIDKKRLISEETTHSYQQEFRNIGMQLSDNLDYNEWNELYNKLIHWEIQLDEANEESMEEIFKMQKTEANLQFSKYIERNYVDWVNGNVDDVPSLSHTVFKNKIANKINQDKPTFILMIDNLRLDQWRVIRPYFKELFNLENEDSYYSILPTATQYARNAFFAGLMPSEIEKKYPEYWVHEHEEGSKNQFEKELFGTQLKRLGLSNKYSYHKILTHEFGKKMLDHFNQMLHNDINVLVYNFVDMLSHARTDMQVIRELASDDAAYRSLTLSWFEHSNLYEMIKKIADKGCNIILTSDHGTIKVDKPVKIVGDKEVNTNLRYKLGKHMSYDADEVFEVKNPNDIFLPKLNVSTAYVFTKNNDFFAYPNNFNHYVKYYTDTFQHGGISLEEVIVPLIFMESK